MSVYYNSVICIAVIRRPQIGSVALSKSKCSKRVNAELADLIITVCLTVNVDWVIGQSFPAINVAMYYTVNGQNQHSFRAIRYPTEATMLLGDQSKLSWKFYLRIIFIKPAYTAFDHFKVSRYRDQILLAGGQWPCDTCRYSRLRGTECDRHGNGYSVFMKEDWCKSNGENCSRWSIYKVVSKRKIKPSPYQTESDLRV